MPSLDLEITIDQSRSEPARIHIQNQRPMILQTPQKLVPPSDDLRRRPPLIELDIPNPSLARRLRPPLGSRRLARQQRMNLDIPKEHDQRQMPRREPPRESNQLLCRALIDHLSEEHHQGPLANPQVEHMKRLLRLRLDHRRMQRITRRNQGLHGLAPGRRRHEGQDLVGVADQADPIAPARGDVGQHQGRIERVVEE